MSVKSIVIALAKTGKNKINRIAVIRIDHERRDNLSKVIFLWCIFS